MMAIFMTSSTNKLAAIFAKLERIASGKRAFDHIHDSHSTRTSEEFVGLLEEFEIALLADVRSIPRSRSNPQFESGVLAETLSRAQIAYRHLSALGGLRGRTKGAAPSPNTYWQNKSFRNYADYAMTASFRAGLDELVDLAAGRRCAIMCAEAVWWRCHRRIITDYLLIAGVPVSHIMGPGKAGTAALTPAAQVLAPGVLAYSAAASD
jgi:uncharacterized protein (DUF488 family)